MSARLAVSSTDLRRRIISFQTGFDTLREQQYTTFDTFPWTGFGDPAAPNRKRKHPNVPQNACRATVESRARWDFQ